MIQAGHWATQPGQVVLATGRQRPRILRRLHDDGGCRHASAEADRRRPRELDHRLRLGVGRPRRDSASPGRGRNKRHPDALPVRRRQDRRAAPRRRGQAHGGSAARCARRNDVVLHRQGRGGRQHRPVRPVLARLRDPRDCDVGADRRECRQRRGRLWVPADRDPEEHRLHADAGRRGICGPGCAPGPRRLPRRSRGRQPARNSAPSAERERLRRRSARRPDLGRRRGTRRNPRSGRRRRAPARPASRPAQQRSSDRDRTGPSGGPRLRRTPAARPDALAASRDNRARRPVRTTVTHPAHARGSPARGDGGHVRRRTHLVPGTAARRDLTPEGRAGADPTARERLPGRPATGEGRPEAFQDRAARLRSAARSGRESGAKNPCRSPRRAGDTPRRRSGRRLRERVGAFRPGSGQGVPRRSSLDGLRPRQRPLVHGAGPGACPNRLPHADGDVGRRHNLSHQGAQQAPRADRRRDLRYARPWPEPRDELDDVAQARSRRRPRPVRRGPATWLVGRRRTRTP